jgi:hypothetical protein
MGERAWLNEYFATLAAERAEAALRCANSLADAVEHWYAEDQDEDPEAWQTADDDLHDAVRRYREARAVLGGES